MKKYILLLFIFCLQLMPTKAQWVTIPDANFATKLQQLYPNCMNGNLMDTTCLEIVNETHLFLNSLNISNLTGIQYFTNLDTLICQFNQLTDLPALPVNLIYLNCSYNQLTSLPALSNPLQSLGCYNNQLTSLPTLPLSLSSLICAYNQLTSIPTIPNTLQILNCFSNQISSLPALPNTLTNLDCGMNQLTNLPNLPNSLVELKCGNSSLTSLPTLPNGLQVLTFPFSQVTILPQIPNTLITLGAHSNQLTSLPMVPSYMLNFDISNNNITCVQNLPQSPNAIISNNPLTCVPNQTNYSSWLPLCWYNDSVNNPNNCQGVNITGNVYTDLNINCNYDSTDLQSENISVKLFDTQNNYLATSYTQNGVYSFAAQQPDTFVVKIDDSLLPVSIDCGQSNNQLVTLEFVNQTISSINFPVVCDSAYDLNIRSINTQGWVFPGQIHTLKTNISSNEAWYNLDCGSFNYSGTVSINITGPVTYYAPANNALTPTVNGNTFTYNITDFSTITPQSFGLKFLTDTTAQAGDQICVHVEINPTPLDADTTNNIFDFCYQVVNSYDPNMKEVYPVNVLPSYNDWFTYTIHFQNTGNAPAFNIRLRDTLDANLDINTFEIRGYSHPAIVSINGNNLTVRFNNIMLPDSTTDYEGSMGYFQYRIKPLPNLPLGTQIENTAYIYFDYNAPIVTNTTQNNFQLVVSTFNVNDHTNQLKVFPNPANEVLTINLQNASIENCIILNTLGQKVYNSANEINVHNKIQLNISNLKAGVYFVKVRASNGSYNAKFIKAE